MSSDEDCLPPVVNFFVDLQSQPPPLSSSSPLRSSSQSLGSKFNFEKLSCSVAPAFDLFHALKRKGLCEQEEWQPKEIENEDACIDEFYDLEKIEKPLSFYACKKAAADKEVPIGLFFCLQSEPVEALQLQLPRNLLYCCIKPRPFDFISLIRMLFAVQTADIAEYLLLLRCTLTSSTIAAIAAELVFLFPFDDPTTNVSKGLCRVLHFISLASIEICREICQSILEKMLFTIESEDAFFGILENYRKSSILYLSVTLFHGYTRACFPFESKQFISKLRMFQSCINDFEKESYTLIKNLLFGIIAEQTSLGHDLNNFRNPGI